MNIILIVQARLTSSRFPKKVLKPINETTVLETLIERVSFSKSIKKIVVAIPNNKENSELKNYLIKKKINVFLGDEEDVLDRFYKASLKFNAEVIIRITGDCPLADASLIDEMIKTFYSNEIDYLSNIDPPTFPDGLDIEIFNFSTLKKAWELSKKQADREHVTLYIRRSNIFKKMNFLNKKDLSFLRLTIDEEDDYKVIKKIFEFFYPNKNFKLKDIMKLYKSKKEIFDLNKKIIRNEGAKMSNAKKLWSRAKKIIPGGNMLLSKRPEMFLPNKWPTYFSKAKGYNIWDIDNNKYIDFSFMGIGTNVLGYGNKTVDKSVKKVIEEGNMSTLNAPEEVYLAEKLIDIHPWSEMVRFARTGGEANSIAVRIARAASGKDKIAICGYHGWHDWYLSANLGDNKGLDGHLLPGLQPKGVPRSLKNTTIPFTYGDLKKLKQIISQHDIGVIKMEVCRSKKPDIAFLSNVRELADKNNIVLIFDECTSGFRETFGGLHKKVNINPDILILGKALGNGYAITAVLGKREIMEHAQSTFISSTFWTERIGSVAANATLLEMEKTRSWEIITQKGNNLINNWKELALTNKLDMEIIGIPALCGFYIKSKNWIKYKTLITQEMLSEGILATNIVYSSIVHDKKITEFYLNCLDKIFKTISKIENDDETLDKALNSEVCHTGFKRLN